MSDNDKNIYFWSNICNFVPSSENDIPNSFLYETWNDSQERSVSDLAQQCVSADFSEIIPGLHQQIRSESREHFKWKMCYKKYCKKQLSQ